LLRRVGLRTVKLGVESLSNHTLFRIKKGTNLKMIERAFRILKNADIMIHANLMLGYPWESKQEAYGTIEVIKKLEPNQAQFSLLIPYPNTELYDMAKANGWLNVKEGDWEHYDAARPMLKMKGLTNEEIVQLYRDSWSKFYFNGKFIFQHLRGLKHYEGVKQLARGFISIYYGHMKAVDT